MKGELIVDSFAGGGGASLGIERALGRPPDIAINHDAVALSMHRRNHPQTRHMPHNVWKVDPVAVTQGRPVGLLWALPDCKHFSKAKGGKPVARNIRDLAWVVVRWARQVRPRVICLENVEEFRTWGPLTEDGQPCPDRKGETFKRWLGELRKLGYVVEHRELRACDFGAPTIRKRLFLIARCDGRPIVWPEPSHGDPKSEGVRQGRLKPWRTAAEIINWSLPCASIFLTPEEGRAVGVKRPLAEATMARIAKGVKRYVLDAAEPFVVTVNHGGSGFRGQSLDDPFCTLTAARDAHGLVAPTLMTMGYGERPGQSPRVPGLDVPLRTVVAGGGKAALIAPHLMTMRNSGKPYNGADEPSHTVTAGGAHLNVVAAFLAQHNLGAVGHDARSPVSTLTSTCSHQAVVSAGLVSLRGSDRRASATDAPHPTVTAQGVHSAEVRAFLVKYYGQGGTDQGAGEPLHTVPTKARFGLVTVGGETYEIADIGMRMLTPRELFRAQGFPESYEIDAGAEGERLTQAAQIRMCGNSVSPPVAEAIVAANYQPDEICAPDDDFSPLPLFAEVA